MASPRSFSLARSTFPLGILPDLCQKLDAAAISKPQLGGCQTRLHLNTQPGRRLLQGEAPFGRGWSVVVALVHGLINDTYWGRPSLRSLRAGFLRTGKQRRSTEGSSV